ncbi:hypothetical protein QBB31_14260 [Streptomyces scabiei]|uniref:hypothetical protein n=1 Tax=Streptomyces scabiei TaxID=1930 RepID=UPI002FF00649
MRDIVVIAAFVVTPLSGVVTFWLALRFLRLVYKRGGAADLAEAATSLLLARGIQPNGRERATAPDRGEERRCERGRQDCRQDGAIDEVQPQRSFPQADLGQDD